MTTCQACGAEIVFAVTVKGKSMPVDVEPADNGNVQLVFDGPLESSPPRAIVSAQPPLMGGPFHLSHFVTCPRADQFRRKR